MQREVTPCTALQGRRRLAARHPVRFRDDERGQLLILTGVLLVLGFVVIGSTVVQLRSLEEHTARIERDALLDSVDQLIANFNQTIIDSVELGDTNTTDFEERVRLTEARLRDTATRSGLYVSVNLKDDPDKDIYWRDSRCGAYEPAYAAEGIIIGYDKVTERETIAGAVYDVHITDGRQSIRMDYYVKVHECMLKEHVSFVDDVEVTRGGASVDWSPSHVADDNGVEAREGPWGTAWNPSTSDALGVRTEGWLMKDQMITDNAVAASNQMNDPEGDYLYWQFGAGADFQAGDTARDLQMRLDYRHTKIVDDDDIMHLKLESPKENVIRSWVLTPELSETTETFAVGNSPSGNVLWTYDEVTSAYWNVTIEKQGSWDMGRTYAVEFAKLDMEVADMEGYQADMNLTWASIPSPYTKHTLEMRYQYTPTPSTEGSTLKAWDYSLGGWEKILDFQNSTLDPDVWLDWNYLLQAKHMGPDNVVQLRIEDDLDSDANEPTDLDIIRLDYLGVRSEVEP